MGFAVGVKYRPAAFYCGLLQVYVAGGKYALPRQRGDCVISYYGAQNSAYSLVQRTVAWTPAGLSLTFLDFLLNL